MLCEEYTNEKKEKKKIRKINAFQHQQRKCCDKVCERGKHNKTLFT